MTSIPEAIREGILRGVREHVEGLFRVLISPTGGDEEAFKKGIAHTIETAETAWKIVNNHASPSVS